MREDYQEHLEQMFKKGYIIVYITPDDNIHYNMWNPDYIEQIFQIEDGLKELGEIDDTV